MKKLFLFIFLVLSIQGISQYSWNKYTFTSGFVDKNPAFTMKYHATNQDLFYWEFMAFERYSGSYSQICILKIGQNGPVDSVRYITNTSTLKRNPAISYIPQMTYPGRRIPYALTIWEEYQGGRWNLIASSYDSLTGWSVPYAFDTSGVNKSNVKIIGHDSSFFSIVYEKNNDIIFRQYNSRSHVIYLDTNLTFNEPANCNNPIMIGTPNFLVAFEKLKNDNTKAIYHTFKTGTNTWSVPDTTAYIGNNIIDEFACNIYLNPELVFHSDRTGKYRFYSTLLNTSGQNIQSVVLSNLNNSFNYSNFHSFLYPIITDVITFQVCTFLKKSDSTKLFCGPNYSYYDSTTLGDTSINVKPSMNGCIDAYSYGVIWVVYTKDSLSFSNIYAKRTTMSLGSIQKTGNLIPGEFKLEQNYPNPFNPVTKIKFDIPTENKFPLSKGGLKGVVSLKVFDITGRDIQTLVNEKLSPGTYEVMFDGSNFASGVYFYQLTIGNEQFAVKKMVLMK